MKQNIILTGMPGSGKTTIGEKLARKRWYDFSDFDDDVLEKITHETAEEALKVLNLREKGIIPENLANKEVKDLLKLLGDDDFLNLEGFMGERLTFENPTIVSTSGSLPLKLDAINHLKKDGHVIYIDVAIETILNRLELMKVDRIVGMGKMTLEEILEYRKKYYDITKDFNFSVPYIAGFEELSNNEVMRQQNEIFNIFMAFFEKNKVYKY